MSLEKARTMKLNLWSGGESRRGWIRLGNDMPGATRCVPESKNNRYNASIHRHGGVCGVKEPYLVDVNREVRRQLLNIAVYKRRCDG